MNPEDLTVAIDGITHPAYPSIIWPLPSGNRFSIRFPGSWYRTSWRVLVLRTVQRESGAWQGMAEQLHLLPRKDKKSIMAMKGVPVQALIMHPSTLTLSFVPCIILYAFVCLKFHWRSHFQDCSDASECSYESLQELVEECYGKMMDGCNFDHSVRDAVSLVWKGDMLVDGDWTCCFQAFREIPTFGEIQTHQIWNSLLGRCPCF